LYPFVEQITGQAGIQWKLLLESRTSEVVKFDLEVSDLGYDQIDGRHLPVISVTSVTGKGGHSVTETARVTGKGGHSVTETARVTGKGGHSVTETV
jgi:hypothetical protein